MFESIDHVGVAVSDLERASALYEGILGMPVVHRETVESQGVEAALVEIGDAHVELLRPLGPQTVIGRFIEKRGEGLHHVAYRVEDIDVTLARLKEAGVRLIDAEARIGIRGSRVAFLHPKATGGVLTELVEPAPDQ
jgi:methylmalonyl-CoA/ethylmalonyl-CoA epimerase